MYRRYTIHRDGDLLVEELDPEGRPVEPEPVSADDRLPFEVTLLAPDGKLALQRLIELLEACIEIEGGNLENWKKKEPGGGPGSGGGGKLPIL